MIKSKSLALLAGALLGGIPAFAAPAGSQPGETWTSLGTGLYTDNALGTFYAISSYPEVEVEIEESNLTKGRYRLVNPYANYPYDRIGSPGCLPGDSYIYINASDPVHVYVETSRTGLIAGDGQELVVGSMADDYYNNLYGNWALADKEGICGTLADGCITFPPMSLLTTLYEYSKPWDDDIVWKQCDRYGRFKVRLPGAPDLDMTITHSGIDEARENLLFDLTLGKSTEKALVALVRESDPGEDTYDKIVAGTIPSVTVTGSGEVKVPYTGDGVHTLMVIPYFEGTPRKARTLTLEIAYDESEWRKAGKARYTEGILASNEFFNNPLVNIKWPEAVYEVNVEESVSRPGYLRLVNAYGPDYPHSKGYYYNDSHNWYILIDASNPDKVVMETSKIGLDIELTAMTLSSKAYRYMNDPAWGWDDEKVTKAGLYGTFKDNRITFPDNSLSLNFLTNPNGWYEANCDGRFMLEFEPGQINGTQSGIPTLPSDEDAPEEYYSVDGLRLDAASLPSGLVIVRKGAKAEKIFRHR